MGSGVTHEGYRERKEDRNVRLLDWLSLGGNVPLLGFALIA